MNAWMMNDRPKVQENRQNIKSMEKYFQNIFLLIEKYLVQGSCLYSKSVLS